MPESKKHRELTYRELPDASIDELIASIHPGPNVVSQSDLLAEIDRRRTRVETNRMISAAETTRRLTWAIAGLTVGIAVLTVVIAVGTIALLAKGG